MIVSCIIHYKETRHIWRLNLSLIWRKSEENFCDKPRAMTTILMSSMPCFLIVATLSITPFLFLLNYSITILNYWLCLHDIIFRQNDNLMHVLISACSYTFCGDGTCVKINKTNFMCDCNDGASNLLNSTESLCLKDCKNFWWLFLLLA